MSTKGLRTAYFYHWERRGRGVFLWEKPVAPEPPFAPFNDGLRHSNQLPDDGVTESPSLWQLIKSGWEVAPDNKSSSGKGIVLPEETKPFGYAVNPEDVVELRLHLPPDFEPNNIALTNCFAVLGNQFPVSF